MLSIQSDYYPSCWTLTLLLSHISTSLRIRTVTFLSEPFHVGNYAKVTIAPARTFAFFIQTSGATHQINEHFRDDSISSAKQGVGPP